MNTPLAKFLHHSVAQDSLNPLAVLQAEENDSTARSPLHPQHSSDDVPDRPSAAACKVIQNVLQEGKSADSETQSHEEQVFAAMRENSLASIVGMTAHRSDGVSALLLALEKNVLAIAGDPENPEGFMITRYIQPSSMEEGCSKSYSRFSSAFLGRIANAKLVLLTHPSPHPSKLYDTPVCTHDYIYSYQGQSHL